MAAEMSRIEFPETPDWEFALRRIPTLSASQVQEAVNTALSRWEADEAVAVEDDLAAQHFVTEQLQQFTEEYDEESGRSRGMQLAAIPDNPAQRSDIHSCVWVLGLLGVLQAAGFYFEDQEAPFSDWPEGQEDPAWWPES